MSRTAFSVVLMKARCPFWLHLICQLRSIRWTIAVSSHGCVTCSVCLARFSKGLHRTCLISPGCHRTCLISPDCHRTCLISPGCHRTCLISPGCHRTCLISPGCHRTCLISPGCKCQWSSLFIKEASLRGSSRFSLGPNTLYSGHSVIDESHFWKEVRSSCTHLLMILNFTSLQLHLTSIQWLLTLSSVLSLSGDGGLVIGWSWTTTTRKLFCLDLVEVSACHKITTWELAIMITLFPFNAVFTISGSTLMLLSLWWSMLTTSDVQRISRSEEAALSAISWRQKLLLSWCVRLFSVGWTTTTLCLLTSWWRSGSEGDKQTTLWRNGSDGDRQ